MPIPDLRTIMLVLIFPSMVCFIILLEMWMKYRNRFGGLDLLFSDFFLQSLVVPLMILRGTVPDWISIILSNTLSIVGLVLGYHGLIRFVGKKERVWPGVAGIVIFVVIQTWFTYGYPSLEGRSVNVAFASMLIFVRTGKALNTGLTEAIRRTTIGVRHVFFTFAGLEAVRVIKYSFWPLFHQDFFIPNVFESWVMIAYLVLTIMIILSFMSMISSRLYAEVKTEQEKFHKAFHSAPYAMIITRLSDGKVLEVNTGFSTISGYSAEEVIGKTMAKEDVWLDGREGDAVLNELTTFGKVQPRRHIFRTRTGRNLHGNYSAELITLDGTQCVISTINDITDHVQAQDEIRLLNEELERRVQERTRELEAFTYSVSHDLRAPLRAIDGFSRILVEDFGFRLDKEGKRLLEVITRNIHKMGRLIDELLGFSRLGRVQLNHSRVDMNMLVNAVMDEVLTPDQRDRAEIQLEQLPDSLCDGQLMHQVWINLISNALKFSSEKKRIEIAISSETKDSHVVYKIRDNGAGFDMKYYSKLFGVFQRLHSENEFEGNGVGLAIVQRIIQRHRGDVWAHSTVGEGSTFYFSLPT